VVHAYSQTLWSYCSLLSEKSGSCDSRHPPLAPHSICLVWPSFHPAFPTTLWFTPPQVFWWVLPWGCDGTLKGLLIYFDCLGIHYLLSQHQAGSATAHCCYSGIHTEYDIINTVEPTLLRSYYWCPRSPTLCRSRHLSSSQSSRPLLLEAWMHVLAEPCIYAFCQPLSRAHCW
jgi:hypothetical protein